MAQMTLPVQVAPEGGYFVDGTGKPLLFHGWCAGPLLVAVDFAEASRFLDDRAAEGITALAVDLVSASGAGWRASRSGGYPFDGGIARPRDEYFEPAISFVRAARERGMTVFMQALPLGSRVRLDPRRTDDSLGCLSALLDAGESGASAYGRFLAERFGAADNIIWVLGGSDTTPDAVPLLRVIADQLAAAIPGAIIAAQGRPDDRFFEMFENETWPALHALTSYEVPHQVIREERARRPDLPAVLLDSTYENEWGATPDMIRRQSYWAITGGACGQFAGSTLITPGSAPADAEARSSMATRDHSRALSFLEKLPWWKLRAANYTDDLVAGGVGQHWGVNTCTAATTAERDLAVVYVPTSRPIDIDFSKLAMGQYIVRTFQPGSGDVGPARTFRAAGAWTIEPPGDSDWALVIAKDDLLSSIAEERG